MNYFLPMLVLFLSIINCIYGKVEDLQNLSKYGKDDYLNFFKIPNSSILSYKKEEEENNNGLFRKVFSFISKPFIASSTELTNEIELVFKKTINFNRIVIKACSSNECKITGNKDKIKLFYKKNSENDFILIEDIKINSFNEKIIFSMNEIIDCDELKLELKESENCPNKVKEEDILLLSPETEYINENILNAFDKKDYRMLTLSETFNNKEIITNIENESKKYDLSDYAKNYIKRIKGVYYGEVVYNKRREFTIDLETNTRKIYQRGDIDTYARVTLKMPYAGTNRQSTGIYGRANETFTIYVEKGKEDDPLPSIIFTQHIGFWGNWKGKLISLKEGAQTVIVDDFKITKDYKIPTVPGGPLYIINPYTPEEQSYNLKIYVEGGELFPTFSLYEESITEKQYINDLKECVKLNQQDSNKYFDITELVGERIIITLKATDAYKKYVDEGKSPIINLIGWDNYLQKLFEFDGIQFSSNQPFYNEKNRYVNINIRHVQPYGLAYAYTEHIGIYAEDWIDSALDLVEKEIGWGFPHEIGHMIDIGERIVSETTNNVISKYSETYLQGDGTWGPDRQENKIKYLAPDNIKDKLRGCQSSDEKECKGFFSNLVLNYLVFWDLESIYHGYWGKLDNMYRYNNEGLSSLTKEEKFVYFTNIVLGLDLGYYFTRWGFSFSSGSSIFDESQTSSKYKDLMQIAISENLIDTKTKKKYWYIDYKEYNYMNDIKTGCYKNKDEYDIQITQVTNPSLNTYILTLPTIKCPGHLGFEIYENDQVIGFTYENTYTDKTEYSGGYIPKYKIVAYDRLLDASKESEYKSFKSSVALNQINNNNILNEINIE